MISPRFISCLDEAHSHFESKKKLIAQCYDRAAVISGCNRDVQTIVKQSYPICYFVHCYGNQLNVMLQKAVSQIPQ